MRLATHSLVAMNIDWSTFLHECRPHWLEGQDAEFFFQTETRPFRSHLEPFIVRMSCHEALPNRNMLP